MQNIKNNELKNLKELLETTKRLREPDGCPWDREQTHESLKKYLIEECYEVIEAIDSKSDNSLREELGDLLFQICFHACIAEERKAFCLEDIAKDINEKMIERHPHVFGETQVENSEQVLDTWESIKLKENERKGNANNSPFKSIPSALPSLARALKVLKKADKLSLKAEIPTDETNQGKLQSKEDIADALIQITNQCKELKLDPEEILRERTLEIQRGLESQFKTQL